MFQNWAPLCLKALTHGRLGQKLQAGSVDLCRGARSPLT